MQSGNYFFSHNPYRCKTVLKCAHEQVLSAVLSKPTTNVISEFVSADGSNVLVMGLSGASTYPVCVEIARCVSMAAAASQSIRSGIINRALR